MPRNEGCSRRVRCVSGKLEEMVETDQINNKLAD